MCSNLCSIAKLENRAVCRKYSRKASSVQRFVMYFVQQNSLHSKMNFEECCKLCCFSECYFKKGCEVLAEGEGFEPSVRSPVQRFSRPPRSTTPAPLRRCVNKTLPLVDGGLALHGSGLACKGMVNKLACLTQQYATKMYASFRQPTDALPELTSPPVYRRAAP